MSESTPTAQHAAPTPPPAVYLNRATVTATLAHLAEASATLLAIGYGLGMIALAGDLRSLGLHQTSVLTGFAHDDVLMKGLGVLFNHAPTLITLIMLLVTAVSARAREFVHVALAPRAARRSGRAGHTIATSQLVAFRIALAVLVVVTALLSVWWEGTLVVLAVYAYITFAWRHEWLMSTGALLLTALLGALSIGLVGAYLHPLSLPEAKILTNDEVKIEGGLLGQGQKGTWYIVQHDDGDTNLRIVPEKTVESMVLDEPTGQREPLLYERLFG